MVLYLGLVFPFLDSSSQMHCFPWLMARCTENSCVGSLVCICSGFCLDKLGVLGTSLHFFFFLSQSHFFQWAPTNVVLLKYGWAFHYLIQGSLHVQSHIDNFSVGGLFWAHWADLGQCLKHLNLPKSIMDIPGGTGGKEPACQCCRCERCGFDPWVRKIFWRREWQPNLVFLPGESHGLGRLGSLYLWGH